jgi:hypothetical protein
MSIFIFAEYIKMDNVTGNSTVYLTLEEVNAWKAAMRLPTIIFLIVLIIVGVIGNIVVIVVYSMKYPPTTFRLYILTLAVIDLLSCLIAMPLEIVDNAFPVMFYNEAFCKSGRFIGNVVKIGSALVLVVMAAGRYKKICHPYSSPTTLVMARVLCATAILIAIALSWPNAIIQGIKHVQLPGNLTGYDCTIDDAIRNTKYPFIYSTTLFVVYAIVFVLLTVLYTLVILALKRHTKKQKTMKNEKLNRANPRITNLMIAITVAFILCYLPNCILDALSTFKRGHLFPPSPVVLGTLPLLARTFFINSVINPIIYLIGESKFRNILKQSLRWLYYTVCRPKEKQQQRFTVTESFPLTEAKSTGSG